MWQYLQILFETAHTASIIPLSNEATFYAMKAFGTYNMALPFVLAVTGATLGHLFNWWIGKTLLKLGVQSRLHLSQAQYQKAKTLFHRYGIYALALAWMPLLNFLVVAAGFFHVRPKQALPFIALGLVAHYGWGLVS